MSQERVPAFVAEYATPTPPRHVSVADYAFFAVSSALFMALLAIPLLFIPRLKRVFEDFKLELPAPTQMLITVQGFAASVYAQYWIWLVPLAAPFLLVRIRRETRARWLLIVVLLAGMTSALTAILLFLPMLSLVEGISGR